MRKLLFFVLSLLVIGCEKTPENEINQKLSFGIPEAYMVANESRAFVVVFDNSITDQSVTWSVEPENGGIITEDPTFNNVGIYKAPADNGVYKVYATLVSDPNQKACVKITVSDTAIDDELLFSNENIGGVQNGPTNPTVFTTDKERLITYIHDYHYFNGGALPGTISLKHSDGTIYGPWQTWGIVGQGGVTNAYWVFHPLTKIKPGSYTVIDSDPSTWSHNSGSNYCGFTHIRAMKIN
ncbi:MAG: hypothetical protein MUE37_08915 [Bacteroidales bacterium]|jgi:hypothetical protein|nr:hypothetical protein [Bacteroidales bacterium]